MSSFVPFGNSVDDITIMLILKMRKAGCSDGKLFNTANRRSQEENPGSTRQSIQQYAFLIPNFKHLT